MSLHTLVTYICPKNWFKTLLIYVKLSLVTCIRQRVQSQKTQGFCVANFAKPSDERKSHSKIFLLFNTEKEPCVRKFEGLAYPKCLGFLKLSRFKLYFCNCWTIADHSRSKYVEPLTLSLMGGLAHLHMGYPYLPRGSTWTLIETNLFMRIKSVKWTGNIASTIRKDPCHQWVTFS